MLGGGRSRLSAQVDRSKGRRSAFVPSSITFSRQGCWNVEARSGRARLAFVILVVNRAG
jgi:hypothetical protein